MTTMIIKKPEFLKIGDVVKTFYKDGRNYGGEIVHIIRHGVTPTEKEIIKYYGVDSPRANFRMNPDSDSIVLKTTRGEYDYFDIPINNDIPFKIEVPGEVVIDSGDTPVETPVVSLGREVILKAEVCGGEMNMHRRGTITAIEVVDHNPYRDVYNVEVMCKNVLVSPVVQPGSIEIVRVPYTPWNTVPEQIETVRAQLQDIVYNSSEDLDPEVETLMKAVIADLAWIESLIIVKKGGK
jgi:hypothetical protein